MNKKLDILKKYNEKYALSSFQNTEDEVIKMNIPFALEPIMPQINYEQIGLDLYFEGKLYSQAVENQDFTAKDGLCTLDRHWLKQQLHMDARKLGINYIEKGE